MCCLITGHVHTPSGAPIASAQIALTGGQNKTVATDSKGNFAISVPPGEYALTASARGYSTVSVNLAMLVDDTPVDVVMEPADSPKLRTIGQVTVNGGYTLQRNTIPEMDVTRAQMDALNYTNVLSGLQELPSVIVTHPDAGAPTAPGVVSLRGPDPSEALVTLDGQTLNDGNTGDFDLSQFPVAAFNSINVTEGLGPADNVGSNTFGGAVNFVSLRPTQQDHANFSAGIGSFGTSNMWLNTTGTMGRLGYALAGAIFNQAGQVNQYTKVYSANNVPICPGNVPSASGNCATWALTHLGSSIASRAGLVNLDYNFSERADAGVRIFTMGNFRDESSALNGYAANPYEPCDPTAVQANCNYQTGFTTDKNPIVGLQTGSGNAIYTQSVRAYDGYSRSVLGSGELLADLYASDNNIDLSGGTGAISPYDVSHADKRYNEQLSWGRTFDASEFAFGGYLRQESLTGLGITQTLSQAIDSYFIKGAQQIGNNLRLSANVSDSNYTTFGNSVDWRFGASVNAGPSTVLRASVGTGFRAPLLIERYYFPEVVTPSGKVEPNPGLPPPDSNCVVNGQGNPNEKAEHATAYELGGSHLFSSNSLIDVSIYRTNLRDTIENFYPFGACSSKNGFLYEIPINIGNAVYEGAEARFKQLFPRQHLAIVLSYGLNVAYPFALGPSISNPTSGGSLVANEQFLGVPQQQGSATFAWAEHGFHAATAFTFAGNNNPLGQAPFTTTDVAFGYNYQGHLDLTASATNIFNSVSGPFTNYLAGTPYRGLYTTGAGPSAMSFMGAYPTDQLNILPASFQLTLTVHQ